MYPTFQEEQKFRDPNYKIMELNKNELKTELNLWTRLDLIDWLSWNDRNGVYRDTDSLLEFGNILGKQEAIEIITKQIGENSSDESYL
ncbi:hypothetical protein [uncultured Nonlabens sp.]|uniref:hypothetical protein n=1 Tax=uncultured Nonlabens sp. TaxID=859306 RepID=UPI00262B4415|nr:hypothetical protein [uncultured Nonlabens sp.]